MKSNIFLSVVLLQTTLLAAADSYAPRIPLFPLQANGPVKHLGQVTHEELLQHVISFAATMKLHHCDRHGCIAFKKAFVDALFRRFPTFCMKHDEARTLRALFAHCEGSNYFEKVKAGAGATVLWKALIARAIRDEWSKRLTVSQLGRGVSR